MERALMEVVVAKSMYCRSICLVSWVKLNKKPHCSWFPSRD